MGLVAGHFVDCATTASATVTEEPRGLEICVCVEDRCGCDFAEGPEFSGVFSTGEQFSGVLNDLNDTVDLVEPFAATLMRGTCKE